MNRPTRQKDRKMSGSTGLRAEGLAAAPITAAVTSAATPTDRGRRGTTVGTAGEVPTEVAENRGG